MKSAQTCLRSVMESHGKVMEFLMRASVGALLMFDRSLFLSPLSQSAMWLSYPALPPSPLPSALLALRLKLHCVFFCLFQSLFFLPSFIPYLFDLSRRSSPRYCSHFVAFALILRPAPPAVLRSEQWFVNNVLLETGQEKWQCIVCVHAKQLGPLRALCLPVSFCYWCHISPGTHTTSSQLLVRSLMCVTAALKHLTMLHKSLHKHHKVEPQKQIDTSQTT